MRTITSAWDCTRHGVAVLPTNPCDPLHRAYNYPRIWLLPSHLGLGQSSTVVLGLVTAAAFFAAALAMIPQGANILLGCVYGVALCSPAVMLGVERGNVDLLLLGLVVASVVLLRRHGRASVGAPILLLFAAVLKLFPIFATMVFLRLRSRRALYAFSAVLVLFGIYVLATLGTIREIYRITPEPLSYSFGIKPFGDWANNLFGTYRVHLPGRAWDWLLVGVTVAVGLTGRSRVRRRLGIDDTGRTVNRELDLFVAGAAIYVFLFTLIQSYDYRLVFVLLTVPQLFRWARSGNLLGAAGLTLVLLTLWLSAPWAGVPLVGTVLNRWDWLTSRRPLFGADQPLPAATAAQVLLAVVLFALLAAAMPRLRISRLPTRRESVGLRGGGEPL
jgi:hypothetical protein